ncbi:probable protein phosphatase 2C 76 [Gossypium hirsutum]|uniref:Probable protein phosphatase 2C 76 n=1 Tax=Gossypium hirsutum TaxID=3635 RepID=A0ABM3BU41_GOSHI|nr:probable protein phosphatase 2C 76 [Gossypium hirsutum]XP_040970569.1 probable protein phosphatase 2C 76 [Gossypium hirsutum]XP_040970570.1 probable protein phosphatase 2C 76 [Gossypium hirsutum]XP_040970571.1 probable protein phosphatase 2C 76 [Gossypium hirsutum]XP_040970572.1 probable protein phosphatase 2C 76 [Gossypium hirsutum]XP_040970573.1 probable protein phosphatase 2C 76 [Gossypium hirsutum]
MVPTILRFPPLMGSVCMFGIFDGHFGARAAKYLKPHLFDILMKHPQLMTNTKLAMKRLTYRDDGSAAITAVVVGNRLYVVHVGDSRGIASKAGNGGSCSCSS